MARIILFLILATPLALTGCDFQLLRDKPVQPIDGVEVAPPLYNDRMLTSMWNDIAVVVGTEARQESSCRSMPIGAKPCGGPWSYIVYSVTSTNEAELRSLVASFNHYQARLNRKKGMMSTCDYVMPPPIRLEGGHCRVVPPEER